MITRGFIIWLAALLIGFALIGWGIQGIVKASESESHIACHRIDFNHDGVITVFDILDLAGHFGTYPGSQPNSETGLGYSGRYDLNQDQRIDLADILIIVRRFGERCRQDEGGP